MSVFNIYILGLIGIGLITIGMFIIYGLFAWFFCIPVTVVWAIITLRIDMKMKGL